MLPHFFPSWERNAVTPQRKHAKGGCWPPFGNPQHADLRVSNCVVIAVTAHPCNLRSRHLARTQAVRALRRKVRHFGAVRCTGNGAIYTLTCVRTYHVSQPEMQCTFMCVAFLASALSTSAPACSFFQGHPVSFCTSRKKWGGFFRTAMRDAVRTTTSSERQDGRAPLHFRRMAKIPYPLPHPSFQIRTGVRICFVGAGHLPLEGEGFKGCAARLAPSKASPSGGSCHRR